MLTQLSQVLQSSPIYQSLRQLSARQRLIVALGGLLVLASLGGVAYWSSAPAYVSIFSQLEPSDAGQSVRKLEEAKIPFRLTGGGTEIQVDESDAARARVLLAEAGLPESGRPGFELFDKPSWGMTDFTQRVNYRRALEGELERSLAKIEGVHAAKVHITLSEKSPFRKNERDAQASVILNLRPRVELDRGTVRGVTYLVSSSVERLPSDRVTVLDGNGRVLSAPQDGSAGNAVDRQLEIQSKIETDLQDKVHGLLANLVGGENVRVEVSAKLDFDKVQRRSERYDPRGQVVLSEQRNESAPTDTVAARVMAEQNAVTTNYENSRSVENVEASPGRVARLSIAVVVNDRARMQGDSVVYEARSAEEIARIEDVIRGAVGYDEGRGDQVVVTSARFAPEPELVEPTMSVLGYAQENSRSLISIVALLITLFLGLRFLRVLSSGSMQRDALPSLAASAEEQAAQEEPAEYTRVLTEEEIGMKRVIDEVRDRAMTHPDAAARFIKSWIQQK